MKIPAANAGVNARRQRVVSISLERDSR